MSKTYRFWTAAAIVCAMTVPAAAQQEAGKDHVKELVAQAMQNLQQGTPGQPAPGQVVLPTGPVVNLTEQQAVERATQNNLTIKSERLTPQTWDFSIAASRAAYSMNLTSNVQNINANTVETNVFAGGSRTTSDTQSWSGGVSKQMWRGGGNYSLNWTNSRNKTSATNSTCNPCFNSGLQGVFTQPLMRNFRIDNNRATILTNEISQDIADINLSATEVSTVAQARLAYWELVYARQAVEAAQGSLDLASKLVQDNRAKVEIGTMAPIDVVQAQAEEATRRQQLVTAQATLRNNELALKRLIVSGTDDELWRATIVAIDRPTTSPQAIDLEGAVRNALGRRTDLSVTKKNLESTDVTLRSLHNQTLPQLDLVGTLNLAGRAGVAQPRTDPNTGLPIIVPSGGYFDTLRSIGTWDVPTYNVRLQFTYPLGLSAPKANVARQRLLRQQTETSIKNAELQIATEVTAAALAVRNSLEAMQAATASRELSDQRLQAAQSKFDVGMATNFEVVQAQRDLVDARNRELRELLNYQRALVDFQRVQITPR